MAINLKNPEAHRLLTELADATGESLTEAAIHSFEERLQRVKAEHALRRKRSLASLNDLIAEARKSQQVSAASTKELMDDLWGDDV